MKVMKKIMNNQISIVIPTMNRLETLQETIDSYVSGDILPDQIVIVDQTQDEQFRIQIVSMIQKYSEKVQIDYIYQNAPSSTKARNIGVDICRNDIIAFSDDDITVQKDTIKNVLDIMKDEGISMIAGINSRDGLSKSRIGYLFGKKSYRKRKIGHVTKAMLGRFPENRVEESVETEWAMGFFFVVRKSLIERWNNFWDEKLTSYAYAEDLDFSYSYYKHSKDEGLKCILNEGVVVEHRVSTEWRVPTRKSTMMYVLNREYLSYKHHMGWQSRILMRWCNFGDFLMRLGKRAEALDLLEAQRVCEKHRKELANGILKAEWYESAIKESK